MSGGRAVALAVASVILAMSVVAGPPSEAAEGLAASEQAGRFAAPRALPRKAAPRNAPDVPCPVRKVTPPPNRPSTPPLPSHNPAWARIGGEALATSGLAAPDGATLPPKVTATSWLVADLDSGAVLGGCGPHAHAAPASTQKLLLAAAFLPVLDPERVVTVTRSDLDFEPGSSAVGLVRGGKYSVEKLWLGLLLNSGNDAARVLARLGGADDGLAGGLRAMNAEAHRLGAYQSHVATPSGLDGPGQFSSAYDLALIARACFSRADFRRYVATKRTRIPAQRKKGVGAYQIQNDNRLLYEYPGALGGKTGFTDLARHTFVGAAERDGRRLVVTLLGAERRPKLGWQQGAALLDWGFAQPREASVGRLVEPGELERAAASPRRGAAPAGDPSAHAVDVAASGWSAGAVALTVVTAVAAVGLLGLLVARRRGRLRRRASR